MKIAIIGAGVGGLATANLLAKDGHEVVVIEKGNQAGGRMGQLKQAGFTFDTGPSWYLMPQVFERYFKLLGTSVSQQYELLKLDPLYKVFYEHDQQLTVQAAISKNKAAFEAIEPGSYHKIKRYIDEGNVVYKLALEQFLYTSYRNKLDIVPRKSFKLVPKMIRLTSESLHRSVSRVVKTRQLQQLLEYPSVFLGTSPFEAPAIYGMMSVLDLKEGVFYPKDGFYAITQSLVEIGKKYGVTYSYRQPVERIMSVDGVATGVRLKSGKEITADVVISNADVHHTETKLLKEADRSYTDAYWKKLKSSPSAILVYLGVRGKLPEFEHHNLFFVDAWKENFEALILDSKLPKRSSIYVSKTSHSDKTVIPDAQHENLFILIPFPAGKQTTRRQEEQIVQQILAQIKDMSGVDLTERITSQTIYGPAYFKDQLHSYRGAMLGPAHTLGQSVLFRTGNRSKRLPNLYYVGGTTLPGIGVPLCLISAELIAERVRTEQGSTA